jgi:hypothetical protein
MVGIHSPSLRHFRQDRFVEEILPAGWLQCVRGVCNGVVASSGAIFASRLGVRILPIRCPHPWSLRNHSLNRVATGNLISRRGFLGRIRLVITIGQTPHAICLGVVVIKRSYMLGFLSLVCPTFMATEVAMGTRFPLNGTGLRLLSVHPSTSRQTTMICRYFPLLLGLAPVSLRVQVLSRFAYSG